MTQPSERKPGSERPRKDAASDQHAETGSDSNAGSVSPTARVSEEDVRATARLARLAFSDEEVRVLAGELSRIMEYVSILEDIDTEGVEPLTMLNKPLPPPREDASRPSLSGEDALRNTPDSSNGYIRVPKVL